MNPAPLRALLLDPSRFTAPYDEALDGGLRAAGVETAWVVRPLRAGEAEVFAPGRIAFHFYRLVESIPAGKTKLRGIAKGLSHLGGLARLLGHVVVRRPDVVHVQWAVLPLADAFAMSLARRFCPVVMTVHDTVPFNGEKISALQNAGFDKPIAVADRIIVHTQGARANLVSRGVPEAKIAIVPHGPLSVGAAARPTSSRDPRWTVVLFGQIKPYKGLDVLVAALTRLPEEVRAKLRIVVAGAAYMDLGGIQGEIDRNGLSGTVEMRIGRLDEQEMADLFEEADSFIFPYRQIDASGVYFLTSPLGKWTIASRVGIFAEDMREGTDGRLVPPADEAALAEALAEAATTRPPRQPPRAGRSWREIGEATATLYRDVIDARRS